MQNYGFSYAFSVISGSYLLGIGVLLFLREPAKHTGLEKGVELEESE